MQEINPHLCSMTLVLYIQLSTQFTDKSHDMVVYFHLLSLTHHQSTASPHCVCFVQMNYCSGCWNIQHQSANVTCIILMLFQVGQDRTIALILIFFPDWIIRWCVFSWRPHSDQASGGPESVFNTMWGKHQGLQHSVCWPLGQIHFFFSHSVSLTPSCNVILSYFCRWKLFIFQILSRGSLYGEIEV